MVGSEGGHARRCNHGMRLPLDAGRVEKGELSSFELKNSKENTIISTRGAKRNHKEMTKTLTDKQTFASIIVSGMSKLGDN